MVYLIDAIGMGNLHVPAELPMWERRPGLLAAMPDLL
jgi:hypothetical protein